MLLKIGRSAVDGKFWTSEVDHSGALVGFGACFISADWQALPGDWYYLIYSEIMIAFFFVYSRRTQLNLKNGFSGDGFGGSGTSWRLSILQNPSFFCLPTGIEMRRGGA